MVDAATRVALLARPGLACERLRAALQDAGADVVLVADPSDADVDSVRATGARAVLIVLEPLVEDVLDRFDALLADPDMVVIFDEADVAAKREGWDAARWTRHLAAKLNRHDRVLPPGAEIESALVDEAQPLNRYQRPESDGNIGAFAGEADARALDVPRDFDIDHSEGHGAFSFDPVLAEMDMMPVPSALPAAPLALDDPEIALLADPAVVSDRFRRDLDDLQVRIADMQLEGAPAPRPAANDGAVVVLAGIGGPDAVRQLLAALPAGFQRPVLIQQRLEGARHDKLVRQMQRATEMPVRLAEAGESLQRGHVYVLPVELGVVQQPDGQRFEANGGDVIGSLPAADSAVILLSGADPGIVDAAMSHAFHGAMVAGQSPDGCFDALASEALVARGAQAGAPAELAKMLAARWPS